MAEMSIKMPLKDNQDERKGMHGETFALEDAQAGGNIGEALDFVVWVFVNLKK